MIKACLLDAFSVPAAAVIGDPKQLEDRGLAAGDMLVDMGALCNTLLKLSTGSA